MDKRRLCESIMNNVAKELQKSLNEDFQFDDTEVADKILELVKKDKQIQNVVANANSNDWANVLRGMVKLIKSNKIGENPAKIANIVQLATAILQRGTDTKLQEKMKELTFDDMQYTANFLSTEINKLYSNKGNKQNTKDASTLVDSEQSKKDANEGKQCDENCGENKKVTEARNYKVKGGFSRFLNENYK